MVTVPDPWAPSVPTQAAVPRLRSVAPLLLSETARLSVTPAASSSAPPLTLTCDVPGPSESAFPRRRFPLLIVHVPL